jgi:hypothetical protein
LNRITSFSIFLILATLIALACNKETFRTTQPVENEIIKKDVSGLPKIPDIKYLKEKYEDFIKNLNSRSNLTSDVKIPLWEKLQLDFDRTDLNLLVLNQSHYISYVPFKPIKELFLAKRGLSKVVAIPNKNGDIEFRIIVFSGDEAYMKRKNFKIDISDFTGTVYELDANLNMINPHVLKNGKFVGRFDPKSISGSGGLKARSDCGPHLEAVCYPCGCRYIGQTWLFTPCTVGCYGNEAAAYACDCGTSAPEPTYTPSDGWTPPSNPGPLPQGPFGGTGSGGSTNAYDYYSQQALQNGLLDLLVNLYPEINYFPPEGDPMSLLQEQFNMFFDPAFHRSFGMQEFLIQLRSLPFTMGRVVVDDLVSIKREFGNDMFLRHIEALQNSTYNNLVAEKGGHYNLFKYAQKYFAKFDSHIISQIFKTPSSLDLMNQFLTKHQFSNEAVNVVNVHFLVYSHNTAYNNIFDNLSIEDKIELMPIVVAQHEFAINPSTTFTDPIIIYKSLKWWFSKTPEQRKEFMKGFGNQAGELYEGLTGTVKFWGKYTQTLIKKGRLCFNGSCEQFASKKDLESAMDGLYAILQNYIDIWNKAKAGESYAEGQLVFEAAMFFVPFDEIRVAKPNYLFRGTSEGFAGLVSLQKLGITPTAIDPLIATVFAIESKNYGKGVLYLAKTETLEAQGIKVLEGNVLKQLETEIPLDILPKDFPSKAFKVIDAERARQILKEMGYDIPYQIQKADLNRILEDLPRMSPHEIEIFIIKAQQ